MLKLFVHKSLNSIFQFVNAKFDKFICIWADIGSNSMKFNEIFSEKNSNQWTGMNKNKKRSKAITFHNWMMFYSSKQIQTFSIRK